MKPDFPKYVGPPMPTVLNPLKPGHYWLLLLWIYFQPSRLKHYLYQADPELYVATGGAIFRTWRRPAYRNLYLMALPLTFAIIIMFVFTFKVLNGRPIDLFYVIRNVALVIAFGVTIVMLRDVKTGVIFSMLVGIIIGLIVNFLSEELITKEMATIDFVVGIGFSIMVSVVIGMVIGIMIGVVISIVTGAEVGILVGKAVSIAVSLTVGIVSVVIIGSIDNLVSGMAHRNIWFGNVYI